MPDWRNETAPLHNYGFVGRQIKNLEVYPFPSLAPSSSHGPDFDFYMKLSNLMAWRMQGMLTDAEFLIAKQRCGLC